MPEPANKRPLISTVYTTPLMTTNTALGLSKVVAYVSLCLSYVRLVTETSS